MTEHGLEAVPGAAELWVLLGGIHHVQGDRAKAKAGKHLHVEDFVKVLAKSKNENVVVLHVSRRTGIRRSKHLLRKMVSPVVE